MHPRLQKICLSLSARAEHLIFCVNKMFFLEFWRVFLKCLHYINDGYNKTLV